VLLARTMALFTRRCHHFCAIEVPRFAFVLSPRAPSRESFLCTSLGALSAVVMVITRLRVPSVARVQIATEPRKRDRDRSSFGAATPENLAVTVEGQSRFYESRTHQRRIACSVWQRTFSLLPT